MPGAGTHTTIIQRLAQLAQEPSNPGFADPDIAKFLTDPKANASWEGYATPKALQQRYANLGALGPDIFYLMLDYGGKIQDFEDTVMTIAGAFRCVGKLSGEINNLIDSDLNDLTDNVWEDIQATFGYLKGILVDGVLDLVVDEHNFWSFFLPMREVDNYQKNWYWADFLHYAKTGCFTQKLLDNARAQQLADPNSPTALCLSAYALGYLSHYVADTVGHAYVNHIVESPWRNHWQRHHLVENFMDAFVWARYHDQGTKPSVPTDEQNLDTMAEEPGDPRREGAAQYHYARVNDLCNIGSASIDPILDGAISEVCDLIQKGLFKIGVTKLPKLDAPDDPIFTTWTEFVADTMWQTYPPDQEHPTRMGRYPTPEDIAGAYGAYRLVLSLSTEDAVDPPMPPNIPGDLASILENMWNDITKDLGSVPPPPTVGGDSLSLEALWDATKQYIQWLGEVADAALQALGDLVSGLIAAGTALAADTIKAALFLLNSLLYSIYHSLRMHLVMSAYSVPFTEDLTAMWGPLDLTTLWTVSDPEDRRYPIEPVVSERDFASNSNHPFSPYRPYFRPSGLAPVNVEAPGIAFNERLRMWRTPSDMLEAPGPGPNDMFSANGPAPATTVPLPNPDGTTLTELETFDGAQRYFGGVLANCIAALGFAVPYLAGASYPAGTVLPDYNLDADRGFAWPCWDVDWNYQNPAAPFPWNGADPYPTDTQARIKREEIQWGSNPAPGDPDFRHPLLPNDPLGSPRYGQAWINAKALSAPGVCNFADFPFPSIVIDPHRPGLSGYDKITKEATNPVTPSFGLLTFDYHFAETNNPSLLHSDPTVKPPATADVVKVYLELPYENAEEKVPENDGRLIDFLRALARTALTGNAAVILTNAASWAAGGPMLPLLWHGELITELSSPPVDDALITAMAQLAVTGRRAFKSFSAWAPDAAKLTKEVKCTFHFPFKPAKLQEAVDKVLNAAYTALWAIRSNDPAWRAVRPSLGWVAVSGFDDTPHRPVNVPTAPYPQYDITFKVPNANPDPTAKQTVEVTTRYMIASAHTFVGPDDAEVSSFTNPEPILLAAPASPAAVAPAPWSIPEDTPSIPPEDKIIIYIHGGGSRAEEAVDMANWFIVEGEEVGEHYTVISFDLPNSAYGAPIDIKEVVGKSYDYTQRWVLQFEQRYIIQFIEALETKLGGNIRERIVAVMGGSLGGNMSMLMTDWYRKGAQTGDYQYLQTIVAWSVTAMAPEKFLGVVAPAELGAYLSKLQEKATSEEPPDDHSTEREYIEQLYSEPLLKIPLAPELPPQPIMWYRGGHKEEEEEEEEEEGWQPLKDRSIARSRFDRYEIYSPDSRHWAIAIDLEQIAFSFRDDKPGLSWVTTPAAGEVEASNLMLVAGNNDNYDPNAIYNSTIDVARAHRLIARGKLELWLDTGHSIHNERPHLFAKEIIYFLTHLTAGDSPNGTVVSTPPKAPYSLTDR